MPRQVSGRRSDRGATLPVTPRAREPSAIEPHPCAPITRQADGDRVGRLLDMIQSPSGPWYCHALLLAARELVSRYRVEGEADWTAIAEIIGETLPEILAAVERETDRVR